MQIALDLLGDLIAGALLLAAVWLRVATNRIPNVLTLVGLGCGVGLGVWQHGVWGGLQFAGAGALAGLVIGGYLAWIGAARGGDFKLVIALGALAGVETLAVAMLAAALLGTGVALFRAVRRRLLPLLVTQLARMVSLNAFVIAARVDRTAVAGSTPLVVLVALGGLLALGARRVVGW